MNEQATDLSNWRDETKIALFLSVTANRVPVDYVSFAGSSRVVCIGDWHVGYSVKQEFCRFIPAFRSAGFTQVALELLPVNAQPLLDRYFAGQQNAQANTDEVQILRKQIKEVFFRVWGDDSSEEEQKQLSDMSECFMQMVDAAVTNGMKVLAMEPPVARPFADNAGFALLHKALRDLPVAATNAFERFWSKETDEAERVLTKNELVSYLVSGASWLFEDASEAFNTFDVLRQTVPHVSLAGFVLPRPENEPGDFDQPWSDAIDAWRDCIWTRVVEGALKAVDTRLLVFAGAGHFGYKMPNWPAVRQTEKRFNELIDARGHASVVIGFAGGDYPRAMEDEAHKQYGFPRSQSMILTDAVQTCNLSQQKFAFKINGELPRESDWVVYLPREAEL